MTLNSSFLQIPTTGAIAREDLNFQSWKDEQTNFAKSPVRNKTDINILLFGTSMKKILMVLFVVSVLLSIAACTSQAPLDSQKCAQKDADICDGLSAGDEVPSCDACNSCTCNIDSEGNMYALCTEEGCEQLD